MTIVVASLNILCGHDFTKIYIDNEGWVYLTAYLDLCSRKIKGHLVSRMSRTAEMIEAVVGSYSKTVNIQILKGTKQCIVNSLDHFSCSGHTGYKMSLYLPWAFIKVCRKIYPPPPSMYIFVKSVSHIIFGLATTTVLGTYFL